MVEDYLADDYLLWDILQGIKELEFISGWWGLFDDA